MRPTNHEAGKPGLTYAYNISLTEAFVLQFIPLESVLIHLLSVKIRGIFDKNPGKVWRLSFSNIRRLLQSENLAIRSGPAMIATCNGSKPGSACLPIMALCRVRDATLLSSPAYRFNIESTISEDFFVCVCLQPKKPFFVGPSSSFLVGYGVLCTSSRPDACRVVRAAMKPLPRASYMEIICFALHV